MIRLTIAAQIIYCIVLSLVFFDHRIEPAFFGLYGAALTMLAINFWSRIE